MPAAGQYYKSEVEFLQFDSLQNVGSIKVGILSFGTLTLTLSFSLSHNNSKILISYELIKLFHTIS
jgi:hypothetical protein